MTKNLVIVESPSKSKTIEKYLGKDYKVVSSKGHIMDLATTGKYGLGVDLENNFKPSYTAIKGKSGLIKELKKEVKDSDSIFLATDPDREGEAISWHLKEALKIDDQNYQRIVFNEITKKAILDSFSKARLIDDDLVRSQETRRILDRIIGFRLSKLMQSKTDGKSAGRVQSVALKLIVDREREIEAFKEEEYWTIEAMFKDFSAKLASYQNNEIKITNEEEANRILDKLTDKFRVSLIEQKEKVKNSKYPFTTSTLQQEASTKLGFSAKKTMQVAQKLYEGISLSSETVGLISYMRTDSIRLSDDFVKETKSFIKNQYGEKYVGYVKQLKKKDNVQDAHEAIRPTSIMRKPDEIKSFLSNDEYKLYKLIYTRTLASLMANAMVKVTSVTFDNNDYQFKTSGQILIFDGYLKVYALYEDSEDKILPEFIEGSILTSDEIVKEQHFTKPPTRYTESKLVKAMEELGIGRPSTYAPTIDLIEKRGYVKLIEKKFHPTEIGIEITDKLQEFFSDIINVEYTAKMEENLDKIADGKIIWHDVLNDFYQLFEPRLGEAFNNMERKEPVKTGEICPECGRDLIVRKGRYGEFVGCSNYPECKYIKPKEKKEEVVIIDCPECAGKIIERKSKKGKIFYGCNNFPKCKCAFWDKPINEKCPECGHLLTEKKNIIKCSSCEYEK